MEAAEFGSGVFGYETPVAGGGRRVALRPPRCAPSRRRGCFLRSPLAGVAPFEAGPSEAGPSEAGPSEAGPSQHAELDPRHPFGRLRTGFSQLPCLGAWWNTSRRAMGLASAGGRLAYRDALRCVFKLLCTKGNTGISGWASSTSHRIRWAKSCMVRCRYIST